jgi:hypothetical protein
MPKKEQVPDFAAEPPARAGYLWKRSEHGANITPSHLSCDEWRSRY